MVKEIADKFVMDEFWLDRVYRSGSSDPRINKYLLVPSDSLDELTRSGTNIIDHILDELRER